MFKATKAIVLFLMVVALTITVFSCKKINESIQRDIIITPTSGFAIPIIQSVDVISNMGTFNASVNVGDSIKTKAPDFNVNDLKQIKLMSIAIEITDTLDNNNNIANLGLINFIAKAPGLPDLVLGVVNTSSTNNTTKLSIPVSSNNPDITKYVTSSSLNYQIIGQANTVTTKIINAKATLAYKLNLAM